jgi:hypothetical protein
VARVVLINAAPGVADQKEGMSAFIDKRPPVFIHR